MSKSLSARFNVGGIFLNRPFKIRRLGHFGFNLINMEEGVRFYTDLLGFRISDIMDYSKRATSRDQLAGLGDPKGYFTRYGSDHHALVLFNKRVREALGTPSRYSHNVTINQITWQVGSLREVGNAIKSFKEEGVELQRTGRDMPGSNWHTYLYDPDGHSNELYYGIEQIGWIGKSKPSQMYNRGFHESPKLPQIGELDEVRQAIEQGINIISGHSHVEQMPATFDVDGILLPRPFKIVRLGPVGLFVKDVKAAERFYRHTLGFTLTEEVLYKNRRCVFMRANTEHHSLALYPITLRDKLGFSPHTTCLSLGIQMANYQQLRDAVRFLREKGVQVDDKLAPELHPGIDYAAHALDPDGHRLLLYYYMEQVGWDGRHRPKRFRRKLDNGDWPETLDPMSDTYQGEPFLGPWG